ncbi:uncharacterized protein LOC141606109 isoform X4 [Silene latifolia]|uniref:uncharacterized protein LOC141606109 isoform X4 n=1 Tax=Silene latifolia TaxID=37657 RepID=UPI003D778E96
MPPELIWDVPFVFDYDKRDHLDDDLFLKQLGDAQVPWRTQLKNYPKHADEPLIKNVVAFIIWQDTKFNDFWEELHKLSPPDQDDSLYSHVIQKAASLVYFLYTQANLFKIGHELTLDKQMDKIFTQVEEWAKKGTPIDEACKLLVHLMADKDEFSLITENHLADVLRTYTYASPALFFRRPDVIKVILPSTDKDQLFDDITEVVRKEELSPAQLTADEYTHWMMTLLREEVTLVEYNLISRAMGEHPMVRLSLLSDDKLESDLFCLLLPLLADAKERIKCELINVLQPLYELCNLHLYQVCTEISETVQVADLRRMSLGSRFIGRSHLIWAFYKLGYGGEKMIQLDHFIYAVLNTKDIDFDEEQWTEFYQDFKDFQKALESMETEIEPKSTVTVRPCGSLNVFSDSSNGTDDSQERTHHRL